MYAMDDELDMDEECLNAWYDQARATEAQSIEGTNFLKCSMPQALLHHSQGLINPINMQRTFKLHLMTNMKPSLTTFNEVFENPVYSLDIDHADKLLISGGENRLAIHDLTQRVVDGKTFYKTEWSTTDTATITMVQWNTLHTNKFTCSSERGLLQIWDANLLTVAENYRLRGVHCHEISKFDNIIAASTADKEIQLIDWRAKELGISFPCNNSIAKALQWSPVNAKQLATGHNDGSVKLWDVRKASRLLQDFLHDQTSRAAVAHPDGAVYSLKFVNNNLHLATFDNRGHFHMWNTCTGSTLPIKHPQIYDPLTRPFRLCVSKDLLDDHVFIPTHFNISSFGLSCPQELPFTMKHCKPVMCITYHDDQNQVIIGDEAGKIVACKRCREPECDEEEGTRTVQFA